jgi:hypothetical protein
MYTGADAKKCTRRDQGEKRKNTERSFSVFESASADGICIIGGFWGKCITVFVGQ